MGNRCEQCRKRVGLLGIQCRCLKIFCAKHSAAEEHNCTFDYKKEGRKVLAKQAKLEERVSS